MSLDQFVACRRKPKLPDDLPDGRWTVRSHDGIPFYDFEGPKWLVSINVEPEFPAEMKEQLADDLADAGIEGATPDDYGVLVSVSLEPVTRDEEALGLQMAVLDMLVETCDGVVMAN